jgi:outer membrane protein TolC
VWKTWLAVLACAGFLTAASPAAEEWALDDVFGWMTRQRVSVHMSTVIRQALEESVDIDVDRYDPLVAAARLRSAKGPLEPVFDASLNYQHRERIINEFDANSLNLIRNAQSAESQSDQLQTRIQDLSSAISSLGNTPDDLATAGALNSQLNSANLQLQNAQSLVNAFDPGALQIREFEEDFRVFRAGLSQRLATGTRWELSVSQVQTEDSLTTLVDNNGRPIYPFAPHQEEAYGRLRITQPLLRDFGFDANLVEIRVARSMKSAADAEFEANLNRRVSEIIGAYLNLTYALGEVDAQREVLKYSNTLVEHNKLRQKEGLLDIVEVRRAEAALAENEQQYLDAQNRALQQQNRLLRLATNRLDLDSPILLIPVESLEPPKLPTTPYRQMVATALKERTEYIGAQYDVQTEKARYAFTRNQVLPQFDVVGSYAYRGLDGDTDESIAKAFEGNHHEWFAGFQLSIPIGNSRALGNRDRARAQLEQAESRVRQVEANISLQVINALNTCRSGYAQVEKARTGRKYAEETRHAEMRRLEEGLTTTLSVLETQRDLRRALLRELLAQLEYHRALVLLDASQGILLKRHNIIVAEPKAVPVVRAQPVVKPAAPKPTPKKR